MKVGLTSNMRHKVIASLQHCDSRQNSPAFFSTNFERPKTRQVNGRPNQKYEMGPAALPPFGEKDFSPRPSSGSFHYHGGRLIGKRRTIKAKRSAFAKGLWGSARFQRAAFGILPDAF